jgi:hypothetical protein
VRDGARAMQLLQAVPAETQRTFDWGVATAMALAETGRFDQAIAVERQAVDIARHGGDTTLASILTDRLRLFEQHRPSRQPWSDGEAMELVDRPEDAPAASGAR